MRSRTVSKAMSKASLFMSRRRWPASWSLYKCEEAIRSRPAIHSLLWMKQLRKRRSIRRGRRWSFPKLSSRDRKNFSAWVQLPRRITIGRVPRATRTGSASLKQSGISTRKDRRRHRPVWFTTRVSVDGVPDPFIGNVSYISPHAEYTPPVIYSRESRAKLVFMIESVFDPQVSANLHPGQPVDVEFKPK